MGRVDGRLEATNFTPPTTEFDRILRPQLFVGHRPSQSGHYFKLFGVLKNDRVSILSNLHPHSNQAPRAIHLLFFRVPTFFFAARLQSLLEFLGARGGEDLRALHTRRRAILDAFVPPCFDERPFGPSDPTDGVFLPAETEGGRQRMRNEKRNMHKPGTWQQE